MKNINIFFIRKKKLYEVQKYKNENSQNVKFNINVNKINLVELLLSPTKKKKKIRIAAPVHVTSLL